MKTLTYILCFTILAACQSKTEKAEQKKEATPIGFNLKKDLPYFSKRLTSSDTLIVMADLSACTSWWYETLTFTKKEAQIYIQTSAEGEFVNSHEAQLTHRPYQTNSIDSLNFENLFIYMQQKGTEAIPTNSNIFTIIHKTDTLHYYSDGLRDHLKSMEYYNKINGRIYPEIARYQPASLP